MREEGGLDVPPHSPAPAEAAARPVTAAAAGVLAAVAGRRVRRAFGALLDAPVVVACLDGSGHHRRRLPLISVVFLKHVVRILEGMENLVFSTLLPQK